MCVQVLHYKFVLKIFLFFCAFYIHTANGYAQGKKQHRIDSLIARLHVAKEDSNKVTLLLDLSDSTDCADTVNKMRYASDALCLAEKLNWVRGKMQANETLGTIYAECLSDFRKGLAYFENYKSGAESCGDIKCQSDALSLIARIHCKTGQYVKSLDYYKKSLEAEQDPIQQVIRLGKMGTIYNDIGYYEKAQDCYSKGLNKLELYLEANKRKAVANDTIMLDLLLTKIGNIYAATSEYEKALAKYERALIINEQIGNKRSEIFALKNIGKVYELKKEYPTAKEYYKKSLEEAIENNDPLVQAEVLNKLGNIYIETDSLPLAMACTQKALKILLEWDVEKSGRLDASLQLTTTYINLGKIYTQQQQYTISVAYFQKALGICIQTGSLNLKSEVWKELWVTYNQMNEYKKALHAHIQYTAARDSVYNIEKAKEIQKNLMQEDFNAIQRADSINRAGEKKY